MGTTLRVEEVMPTLLHNATADDAINRRCAQALSLISESNMILLSMDLRVVQIMHWHYTTIAADYAALTSASDGVGAGGELRRTDVKQSTVAVPARNSHPEAIV